MATRDTTMVHVKVTKKAKNRALKAARLLGVPLSLVVEQSLRRFADDRRLVIDQPLKPTPFLEKILKEADKDLREGNTKKFSGPFTADEFMEHLRNLARA